MYIYIYVHAWYIYIIYIYVCIYIYISSVYCEQSESTVILTTFDELTCTDGCTLVYRLKVCSATATTSARFCPPFDSEMMPPKEKDVLSPSTTVCVSQLQDMQIPTNLDNHQLQFPGNVSHFQLKACAS